MRRRGGGESECTAQRGRPKDAAGAGAASSGGTRDQRAGTQVEVAGEGGVVGGGTRTEAQREDVGSAEPRLPRVRVVHKVAQDHRLALSVEPVRPDPARVAVAWEGRVGEEAVARPGGAAEDICAHTCSQAG